MNKKFCLYPLFIRKENYMKIIKRSGQEVDFNSSKIETAINKANEQIENKRKRLSKKAIQEITQEISEKYIKGRRTKNVEDIQDEIERKLIERNAFYVAKEFITYRYKRGLSRTSNTTDKIIMSLVESDNEEIKQENSNKNPTVGSTQRDYIAGEISRDITNRLLLPQDIVEAHKNGIIHFHDTDYYIQHMFNCFSYDTQFVTNKGIKKFGDCYDGEKLEVIDKYGQWQNATVRKYSSKPLQKVTFRSGRCIKEVRCTYDHRWILKDGSVTTSLKQGDKLWLTPEIKERALYKNPEMFILGMILGDGNDVLDSNGSKGMRIRLCGKKNKYRNIFEECGYKVYHIFDNGDLLLFKPKITLKENFIKNHIWEYLNKEDLIDIFNGYYCADGSTDRNMISTANYDLLEFIKYTSGMAGYYITSINVNNKPTNFTKERTLYEVRFRRKNIINAPWIVENIDRSDLRSRETWCVEQPINHSFTLANGIVTGNCCLINLKDMLQNGTVISGTMIEKPHSFSTACNIATQIIAQVASNQYGGQTISLAHLAPFVDISRQKIRKDVEYEICVTGGNVDNIDKIVEKRVKEEIRRGVQTIQYQVVTLMTTNGQAPFLSVFMYLNETENEQEKQDLALIIEEVLRQRIQGVKNEKGVWITIAFPKLLYVLEEDNCKEDTKYWYLTQLAAKCTAKRMVPDYISEKVMKENKINQYGNGDCYGCMGCRSFLTPWTTKGNPSNALDYEDGKPKYYGRFNQGVVTINLVDVGLSANKDINEFWNIFENRLELCHKALQCRHNRLKGTKSDVSPIHWQYGAIARLEKGETIDKLLYDGYSTISLGYAGLWECVYSLIGKKLTEPEGEKLGLEIMQKMNDKCNEWKVAEHIDYSVYGTPIESTTYKFAKCLQRRFGIIEGVTDKNYITNSYHIHVTEPIDAFQKLSIESKFQKLSPGGAISYIEVPNLQNNLNAALEVIKFIYEHIMYAELNSKSDYCHVCGYDGEIEIVEDENGKLIWKCPNCGNTDRNKMNIARRVCGYISTNDFNQGRTQEIKERVVHLGNE